MITSMQLASDSFGLLGCCVAKSTSINIPKLEYVYSLCWSACWSAGWTGCWSERWPAGWPTDLVTSDLSSSLVADDLGDRSARCNSRPCIAIKTTTTAQRNKNIVLQYRSSSSRDDAASRRSEYRLLPLPSSYINTPEKWSSEGYIVNTSG